MEIDILVYLLIYLYGSIPFSLLIGKLYNKDIREHGSKNVGASNLGRTCGRKAGFTGFILDFSKGMIAAILTITLGLSPIIAILFALLGHMFPIWIKFKGGKGIATSFGFVMFYTPLGATIAIISFLIVLKISKFVSLSAILAIFVYLLYTIILGDPIYCIAVFILWLFIIYLHKNNIKKIKAGTESKISWF